jgi:hypothetical protein
MLSYVLYKLHRMNAARMLHSEHDFRLNLLIWFIVDKLRWEINFILYLSNTNP